MEAIIIVLLLGLLCVFILPIALLINHGRRLRGLETTISRLVSRLTILESQPRGTAAAEPQRTAAEAVPPIAPVVAPPPPPASAPAAPMRPPTVAEVPAAPRAEPPPLKPKASAPAAPRRSVPAIDWENFLGVKLFAWLGGFVLFLGVVFLVKYSFENNLITPVMRIVIGAVIAFVLIGAGWFTARRNYRVPGQSLCATGVLVLYADIFGAHAFYSLISLTLAFVLMSAVTLVAFMLAVKLNAQVVVVLGLVGGFLTPHLLTNGDQHPLRLFGYVALLNAGIAAVALRKRWDYLLLLAAIGTLLTEWEWTPLFEAARAANGFFVFLAMEAEFLAFAYFRQKLEPREKWSTPAMAIVGFNALAYAFVVLGFPALAQRPGFFFGYTFLADLGLLALAFQRPNPSRIAGPAGSLVFAIFAAWTASTLNHALLWWALGAYILFAIIHAGFSVWPPRAAATRPSHFAWRSYVPLLALALLFLCVWRGETSFAVWACVLLVDVIALALAAASTSIFALVVALVATLITAALWIVTAPPLGDSVVSILIVVGGFGVFFSTASTFLTRKLGFTASDRRRNVPAIAAAMPFVLLLMVIAKLPIVVPTAVFAVTLLLATVLLGLGIVARTSWIALVALAFTWAVEREWHSLHFTNAAALLALGWYVAFFLVFMAYPFFAGRARAPGPASAADATATVPADSTIAWAVGALSGVLHFWLIYEVVAAAYPQLLNGLLPAVFIIPYAYGVWHLIKQRGITPASADARLAWQGGAALLFLSLVFPIQFEREWITLGWALEGLALLALFRAVPNRGLRLVGGALLTTAFVRLALNPAVFEYHPRTRTRIWNWYLYAYGITSVCLFAGARLAQTTAAIARDRLLPPFLYALGTILTFLLLNIEIADYFSVGPTLTFSFSGNFARDMTYSIAWALFAFALLLVGMRKKTKAVRYAGLVLLLATLLKLFLHDLGNLSQLYRIGAFIGVALILIVASFVYQRFLRPAPTNEPT
jgi:hypothetical protein